MTRVERGSNRSSIGGSNESRQRIQYGRRKRFYSTTSMTQAHLWSQAATALAMSCIQPTADVPVGAVREPPTTRAGEALRIISEIGKWICLREVTSGLVAFELPFESLRDPICCRADIAVEPRPVYIHPTQLFAQRFLATRWDA